MIFLKHALYSSTPLSERTSSVAFHCTWPPHFTILWSMTKSPISSQTTFLWLSMLCKTSPLLSHTRQAFSHFRTFEIHASPETLMPRFMLCRIISIILVSNYVSNSEIPWSPNLKRPELISTGLTPPYPLQCFSIVSSHFILLNVNL